MPIPQMSYTTYSFSEVSFVMAHPDLGQCVMTGQGVGDILVGRAQDAGVQEAAADGSVMSTKVVTKHGTLGFTLHQTSAAHKWLEKAYNALMAAPASAWAQFSATIESITTGQVISISETEIQKLPDHSYQQNAQNVTWNFLCGVIDTAA